MSLKELMEQFGGDDFESAKTKEIEKVEKVKAKKQEKLDELKCEEKKEENES